MPNPPHIYLTRKPKAYRRLHKPANSPSSSTSTESTSSSSTPPLSSSKTSATTSPSSSLPSVEYRLAPEHCLPLTTTTRSPPSSGSSKRCCSVDSDRAEVEATTMPKGENDDGGRECVVFARRGCCMSHVVMRQLQVVGANPAVYEVEENDVDDMAGQLAAAEGEVDSFSFCRRVPYFFNEFVRYHQKLILV